MSNLTEKILQINSLKNGKGLQYLLNEAYKIFGNPFLLFNMDYELVAYSKTIVADDHLWNEIVENGVFSSETINFFKNEDFHDTVASSKTIALLTSDKLKYDRFYGRITNSDNSTVIDLILLGCHVPFGDDISQALEAFCRKLSKEISGIDFYQQYGIVYHQTLICKLLDKDIDDRIIYSDHVANLYEGLKSTLAVAVADVSHCKAVNSGLEDFRDLFKKIQREFKYAVHNNYIVILVSTEDTSLNINRDLHKLIIFFERNNVYVGISNPFENLFDLRKYYDEAVTALKHGLETSSHQRVFPYNDHNEG